jgi:NDP-sugar pyrophosphorylase family protein
VKGMILAAGEGTRLRPITLDRPKPMVPVGGKPLLVHLLTLLRRHGVAEVAINLHYLPDAIRGPLGDGSELGMRVRYSMEPELLGTAGAVRKLADFFDERFVVLYGDVLTDIDLTRMAEFHIARGGALTMAVHRRKDPSACGVVELGEKDRITRFVEKPKLGESASDLCNAGVYIVEPEVVALIPPESPADFGRDVFPAMLARWLAIYAYPMTEYLVDIGTLETYRQVQRDYERGLIRP